MVPPKKWLHASFGSLSLLAAPSLGSAGALLRARGMQKRGGTAARSGVTFRSGESAWRGGESAFVAGFRYGFDARDNSADMVEPMFQMLCLCDSSTCHLLHVSTSPTVCRNLVHGPKQRENNNNTLSC